MSGALVIRGRGKVGVVVRDVECLGIRYGTLYGSCKVLTERERGGGDGGVR